MLSKPPQATKLPDGAYAHVITQLDLSGMACTLFVVQLSHTISLPSCDADTRFLEQYCSIKHKFKSTCNFYRVFVKSIEPHILQFYRLGVLNILNVLYKLYVRFKRTLKVNKNVCNTLRMTLHAVLSQWQVAVADVFGNYSSKKHLLGLPILYKHY